MVVMNTKLYYDYDELNALLSAEIEGVGETLDNPNLLYIRETKRKILEQTLDDYFNSGRALKYHNKYCRDRGFDDEILKEGDVFIFEEDKRMLKENLSTNYSLFADSLINDYNKEIKVLQGTEKKSLEQSRVELEQAREKRIAAEQKLENIKQERKEMVERYKKETKEIVSLIEGVGMVVNFMVTIFFGLLGLIFKPLLFLASFTLCFCIGFSAALLKDYKKSVHH